MKRIDSRDPSTKSIFNAKREMPAALAQTGKSVDAEVVMVSFSNGGYVPPEGLIDMCMARGETVKVLSFDSKRYVGALIGIFNPSGEKVGAVSHTRNTEYVLLSGPADRVAAMAAAVAADVQLPEDQLL